MAWDTHLLPDDPKDNDYCATCDTMNGCNCDAEYESYSDSLMEQGMYDD